MPALGAKLDALPTEEIVRLARAIKQLPIPREH
jgi:hypothetical protein